MSKGNILYRVVVRKGKKVYKSVVPTEYEEHKVFAEWLNVKGIPYYHIPNGGLRSKPEAKKLQKMGLKAGIPDICIPVPRKGYGALYIELKRVEGGSLSIMQKEWINRLSALGNCVRVAKGCHDAIEVTEEYFRD